MSLFNTKRKFFAAVAAGDIAAVRAYIQSDREWLDTPTDKKAKNTPLHIAAEAGQSAMIRLLLAEGAICSQNENGDTPLLKAVAGGHTAAVRALMDKADINSASPLSALQTAIIGGHLEILGIFLGSGKANLTDGDPPALFCAVENGKPECVKLLLAAGANPNVPKKFVQKPYAYSRRHSSGRDIVTYESPLNRACRNNQTEIALELLKAGAKILGGEFPIHAAAANGNIPLVTALIQHGLDVRATDAAGQTPLHAAVSKNQLEMARLLLEKGVKKDVADNKSQTALACAQQYALTEMIDLLQDSNFTTALKAAREAAIAPPAATLPEKIITLPEKIATLPEKIVPLPVAAAPLPETTAPLPEKIIPPPVQQASPPEPKTPAPEKIADADVWTLSGNSVVHVRGFAALNRRLTEIFNFETRERVAISENLALKTETMSPHESFDTITEEALTKALTEFRRQGGETPEADVFKNRLGKTKPGLS